MALSYRSNKQYRNSYTYRGMNFSATEQVPDAGSWAEQTPETTEWAEENPRP